jgi:hypothetical protein
MRSITRRPKKAREVWSEAGGRNRLKEIDICQAIIGIKRLAGGAGSGRRKNGFRRGERLGLLSKKVCS